MKFKLFTTSSKKDFCRKKLKEDPLCIIFDLQIFPPKSGSFFTPKATTLRKYFLNKINSPFTTSSYLDLIYQSLSSKESFASLFFNTDMQTIALCERADKRYKELIDNSAVEDVNNIWNYKLF